MKDDDDSRWIFKVYLKDWNGSRKQLLKYGSITIAVHPQTVLEIVAQSMYLYVKREEIGCVEELVDEVQRRFHWHDVVKHINKESRELKHPPKRSLVRGVPVCGRFKQPVLLVEDERG